jgi:hypothetical protein
MNLSYMEEEPSVHYHDYYYSFLSKAHDLTTKILKDSYDHFHPLFMIVRWKEEEEMMMMIKNILGVSFYFIEDCNEIRY